MTTRADEERAARYPLGEQISPGSLRYRVPLFWSAWLERHDLAAEAVPLPNVVEVRSGPAGPVFTIELLARDAAGRWLMDQETKVFMRYKHTAPLLAPVPAAATSD